MITNTGLMPTCRDMTFGTSTWFSTCCCSEEEDGHAERERRADRERDDDRGDGREDWADDRNQLADAGDERQHVEVRDAHQSTGRSPRCVPMMAPSSS